MTNLQPNYLARTATLKDIMFFYEAISAISEVNLDIVHFNTQFKNKIKDKSYTLLVLEADDKKIAGCILAQLRQGLSDQQPYVELQELYIFPKFRKLKGAEFLYAALEEKVIKQKIYQLRVNCNINSTLNQNFYVKKGFKIFKKQYKKEAF